MFSGRIILQFFTTVIPGLALLLPPIPYIDKAMQAKYLLSFFEKFRTTPPISTEENYGVLDPLVRFLNDPGIHLSNYHLFFGLWLILSLSVLLFPRELWFRANYWNSKWVILPLLGLMLIVPVDYDTLFRFSLTLFSPMTIVPILIILFVGLLGIFLTRLYDETSLLDSLFNGYFVAVIHYVVVANFFLVFFLKNFNLKFDAFPDFTFLGLYLLGFSYYWYLTVYDKFSDEIPFYFKSDLDDWD